MPLEVSGNTEGGSLCDGSVRLMVGGSVIGAG
jgi:hypothetical protein